MVGAPFTAHQEDGSPSSLRRSRSPCGARATELRLREDGYEASTSVAFQGRRWRRMALRMVRSLRATATTATIFGLPAAIKRRRKALRTGLWRPATRAAMKRAVRTLLRPPATLLLPFHWP